MPWRFFFGACLLTGAALLPHARPAPVLAGMALAAGLQWVWFKIARRRERRR